MSCNPWDLIFHSEQLCSYIILNVVLVFYKHFYLILKCYRFYNNTNSIDLEWSYNLKAVCLQSLHSLHSMLLKRGSTCCYVWKIHLLKYTAKFKGKIWPAEKGRDMLDGRNNMNEDRKVWDKFKQHKYSELSREALPNKNRYEARCLWLMPVILATQKAEIRRIEFWNQLRQIVLKTLSSKCSTQKELGEWFKWQSSCLAKHEAQSSSLTATKKWIK
jgi:hypothetical protein